MPVVDTLPKVEHSFQLKGSLFTLSVLQLKSNDLELLEQQLAEKIKLAPRFFNNAPVVIECQEPEADFSDFDFMRLKRILTEKHLIPVGLRGSSTDVEKNAQAAGFAIMADNTSTSKPRAAELSKMDSAEPSKPAAPEQPALASSMLITQPIRSGQQIYAHDGDLVVVNSVSPGAELLADGNIHVYGTLRGRALAGLNGNTNARIFCHRLESELVSIAGQYKIFEDIQEHNDDHPKQLFLQEGQLIISTL